MAGNGIESIKIGLTDNERRHAVVGIALNNYLVPQIKEFVDKQMKQYYEKLNKEYKINTSESKLTEKIVGKLGLNIHDQKSGSLQKLGKYIIFPLKLQKNQSSVVLTESQTEFLIKLVLISQHDVCDAGSGNVDL